MKSSVAFAVYLIISLAIAKSASAHHSFAAEFDATEMISIDGTVIEVRFRNPHVQYFVQVGGGAETERWNVQAQNVPSLRRRGWDRDTLKIGDRVTITGFPGRKGARKIYLDSIVMPSGEVLTMFDGDKQTATTTEEIEAIDVSESAIANVLIGHWAFDVDKPLPGAPLHLEFLRDGESMMAVLDHEELPVVVGNDAFTIVLERENAAGFPAQLKLTGRVASNEISGNVEMIAGYTSLPNLHATTFTATKSSASDWEHAPPRELDPIDLTGTWTRIISVGPIGRTNPHLNEAGKAHHDRYKEGLYDPTLRCMSTGPMRRYAAPGLIEIVPSTNRLTILYAYGSDIRRIWFDRERHSDERRRDVMGESLGSWDGSTLVIETRNLTATVLTHNAEPVSDQARIVERYWLAENGELVMEATLHDPTYYERPVVRRTQWRRADGEEMIYTPCDPDSFYRSMQFEGTLEDYFRKHPAGEQ